MNALNKPIIKIISLALFFFIISNCSKEEIPISPKPTQNDTIKGTISGNLIGDGKLVPNREYADITIELYQNSNLLKIDTTDLNGSFIFTELDTGRYVITSTADFGNENIAYANDIYLLYDTLLRKDLILDSIKYDFCPLKVGNSYTYLARDIWACVFGKDTLVSIIEISITDAMIRGDTSLYFFSGNQNYTYFGSSVCFFSLPDSHYVLNGYFKDFNNQVTCVITGNGGAALSKCFKGIHIFDNSDEMKQFLELVYAPIEIEFGILFEVKGEFYETLYINYYFPMNGSSDKKFNFSYQLGMVYSKWWYYGGNTGASGPEITLIDYDF